MFIYLFWGIWGYIWGILGYIWGIMGIFGVKIPRNIPIWGALYNILLRIHAYPCTQQRRGVNRSTHD